MNEEIFRDLERLIQAIILLYQQEQDLKRRKMLEEIIDNTLILRQSVKEKKGGLIEMSKVWKKTAEGLREYGLLDFVKEVERLEFNSGPHGADEGLDD